MRFKASVILGVLALGAIGFAVWLLSLPPTPVGREKATAVARDLGVEHWDARHESDAFTFTRPFATTTMVNKLSFWNRERLGIELTQSVDEVALALVADAWSRTYRSQAVTFAATAEARTTRNGMRILPDEVGTSWPVETRLQPLWERPAGQALDEALAALEKRYGGRTRNMVAMQLEYPR